MSTCVEVGWQTLILCILPAMISVITLPYAYGIFYKDLKRNVLSLSPLHSGLLVSMSFLRLLSWRILNAGDVNLCLQSAAGLYFMDIWSGLEPPNTITPGGHRIARWAFFLLITLPQYVRLATFQGVVWTQIWATCFAMHFVMHELFAHQLELSNKSVEFEIDWPSQPFMRYRSESTSSTASAAASRLRSGKNEPTIKPPKKLNACDAVQTFIFPLAQEAANRERKPMSDTQLAGYWMTLVNPSWVWSCRHVRCLLYRFACIPAYHAPKAYIIFTFLSSTWLLHSDLRFMTVSIADSALRFPSIDEWVSVLWILSIRAFNMSLAIIIGFLLINFLVRRTIVGHKIWSYINDRRLVKSLVVGAFGGILAILGLISSFLIGYPLPTATNTAWVLEGGLWLIIVPLVAYLTVHLLGIAKHDLDYRTPSDVESYATISSGSIGGDKKGGLQKEPLPPTIEPIRARDKVQAIIPCANFLVAFPGALFWYAFRYNSAGTVQSHWDISSFFG